MSNESLLEEIVRLEVDMQTACDILCTAVRMKSAILQQGGEESFPELLRTCNEVIGEYVERLQKLEKERDSLKVAS